MFKEKNNIRFFYMGIDIFFIALSSFVIYFLRFNSHVFSSLDLNDIVTPNLEEYLFIFATWGFLLILSLEAKNMYFTDRSMSILKESSLVLTSLITVSVFIAALIFFSQYKFFSRLVFTGAFCFFAFTLVTWRIVKRLLLRYLIKRGFHNFNILFVGSNEMTPLILDEIKRNPFLGINVVGFIAESEKNLNLGLPFLGTLNDFETVCHKYFVDEIIISSISDTRLLKYIDQKAKHLKMGIRIIPFDFQESPSILSIEYLGVLPLLIYKERTFHPTEFFQKRCFDFIFSLFLLIILLPFFLFIALWIGLIDGTPIFYVQKRMGLKGEIFNFYKFRTMVKNADDLKLSLMDKNEVKNGVIFKIKADPRITRVGRILRRFSLDELPQLFNVLKGNMSLVGPRPFPVSETQKIDAQYISRLNIRPGITGLAQIKGRSDLPFNHWMKLDLWYTKNWSFGIDLQILWWTIATVFRGKGAY